MPRVFTDDWVTWHDAEWRNLFKELAGKPNVTMLEVGSHEGCSACWFLDNVLTHESSRLICIDPWKTQPEREQRFDANIADRCRQVRKIKAVSRLSLPTIPEDSIDAAYVDGEHEGAAVLLDALLTLSLLKIGGILLFDDYQWDGKVRHRPAEALDVFLKLCDYRCELIRKSYQLAVRRVA